MIDRICIDGLIGVGKSTLCERLESSLKGRLTNVPEPDPDQNEVLKAYYKDRSLAGQLELSLLIERFKMYYEHREKNTLLDRCLYYDRVFADMNKDDGFMTNIEHNLYMNYLNFFMKLYKPTLIVFLDASPETCLKRIEARGREYERGISLDYLKELKTRYGGVIDETLNTNLFRNCGFVHVNTDNKSPDTVFEVVKDYLTRYSYNIHPAYFN